ncbi:MAG TPA: hypothetical protein DEH78_06615 [Solibacterales bacterium]|nr:hypothetical protein [Bryobacterales bacterium]
MKRTPTPETNLDLCQYYGLFQDALLERYGQTFSAGFASIEARFKEVRTRERLLGADDVLAIFSDELPFVRDWTKPERQRLEERMNEFRVAAEIRRLRDTKDRSEVIKLISQIRYGFGDLSLAALVLHHVYPERFAMCGPHLASLLYIVNARTVPEFYFEYCEELELWGRKRSSRELGAVKAEFALWTWYRLAHYGRNEVKRKHRNNFFKDPWVQERRAARVANALPELGRLDIARSYVGVDPNLAAIIAWVEFEWALRRLLSAEQMREIGVPDLIDKLPMTAVPGSRDDLKQLWLRGRGALVGSRGKRGRNEVIHQGLALEKDEARLIVDDVVEFVDFNSEDLRKKEQRPPDGAVFR